ncbi:MAG TPA: hypothetical protein PLQ00_16625 [Thermoguttaceae bacterium]|nr:hypothetical protein [Thermoguttaceae bacterium]
MPIEFRCPVCTKRLRVPDGTEGQLAQCPLCGVQSPIPGASQTGPATEDRRAEPNSPLASGYPEWSGQESVPSETFRTESFSPPVADHSEPGPAASWMHPVWGDNGQRRYAYAQIRGPANWLVAMSAIAFGWILVALLLVVLGMADEAHRVGRQGLDPLRPEHTKVFMVMGGMLLLDLLVFFASMKMKHLQNYPLAMTAALLAVIPCTSPCCVLSMPFGLWALVVLTDPAVKAAFR